MMRVYLAAQFARRVELRGYAEELERHGIAVTSRWLREDYDGLATIDPLPDEVAAQCARDDLADIDASDLVVCFTEAPRSGLYTGGRHVEFGYALARQMPIVIVGPSENVFHCLERDTIWRYPTWGMALPHLQLMPGSLALTGA